MKKVFISLLFLIVSLVVNAQGGYDPFSDKEMTHEIMRSLVILAVLYLLVTFILSLIRLNLENRLKKTMLEKGTPENIVAQLLPKGKQEKYTVIKWFTIPAAIGIGLIMVNVFQPLGFHSIIIMIFSIALGFLVYYFLIKRLDD